jgi:hypothetical protein
MTTREQALEMADRARALAAMCRIVFVGEESDVVGAALAETMSTFLCGHHVCGGDRREDRELREQILEDWIKMVRDLLLLFDKAPAGMQ